MKYFLYYLLIINLLTIIIYFIDKQKAKHHSYRISESSLLLLALFGGSIGALFSMKIFHHKTRKAKFYLGIPLIILLQVGTVIYLIFK